MKSKRKQKGGENIIQATSDLISSMVDLGKSIFLEMDSIVNISSQINSVSQQTSLPTVQSPPPVNTPNL